MDLNEIAIFIKVIETGSFSKAALSLDMPKSTVSAKVSALEARLGLTLIRRTTRRLFVTDVGQEFYQKCAVGLEQITTAAESASERQAQPQGVLRLTAPVELGSSLLPEVIAAFRKAYPSIQLELILTDRLVDLVSEGIDLALRAGHLKDSTLISKRLGSIYFGAFASPKYLKTHGHPTHLKDFKEHSCLRFSSLGAEAWTLHGPNGATTVKPPQSILTNDLQLIKALAIESMGIALLPTYYCKSEIQSSKLVRVLPIWRTQLTPVHFVYPQHKFVSKKQSAFLNLAGDLIRKNLASNEE